MPENIAYQYFIGTAGSDNDDKRQHERWYSTQDLEHLNFISPKPSAAFRYIFIEGQDFIKQFNYLSKISAGLEYIDTTFIVMEPSETISSHFIMARTMGEDLLIINPLGLKGTKDFYEITKQLQEQSSLQHIYLSDTKLQLNGEGIVSCGPICMELLLHFSNVGTKFIREKLIYREKINKHGLEFTPVDISELLPESLSGVTLSNINDYKKKIQLIREKHAIALKEISTKNSDLNVILQSENPLLPVAQLMLKLIAKEEKFQMKVESKNIREYEEFKTMQQDLYKQISIGQNKSKTISAEPNSRQSSSQNIATTHASGNIHEEDDVALQQAIQESFQSSTKKNNSEIYKRNNQCNDIKQLQKDNLQVIHVQDCNEIPSHIRQYLGDFLYEVEQGNIEAVRKFIHKMPELINCRGQSNETALHLAAAKGHIDIVKYLLDNKAQIDLVDKYQDTPLTLAIKCNHQEVVNILKNNSYKEEYADDSIQSLIKEIIEADPNQKRIYFKLGKYERIFPKHITLLWEALQLNNNIEEIIITQPSYYAIDRDTEYCITKNKLKKGKEEFHHILMRHPVFNPFLWQINRHFSGLLHNVEQFTEDELNESLSQLEKEINRLAQEGFFEEHEETVRDSIKETLQEHATEVLAMEIVNPKIPKYKDIEIREILANTDVIISKLLEDILSLNNFQIEQESNLDIFYNEASHTFSMMKEKLRSSFLTEELTKKLVQYSQAIETHSSLKNLGNAIGTSGESPCCLRIKDEIQNILNNLIQPLLQHLSTTIPGLVIVESIKAASQDEITERLSQEYKTLDDFDYKEQQQFILQADSFFESENDPLWLCHLHNEVQKITYIPRRPGFLWNKNPILDAFQNGICIIPSRKDFLNNHPNLVKQLKQLGLKDDLKEIEAIEDYLTETYLPNCTPQLCAVEEIRPGFFIQLLKLLSDEKSRIRLYGNREDPVVSEADKISYQAIIEGNNLEPALEAFENHKLMEKCSKLNDKLTTLIEKKRLTYYTQELKRREGKELKKCMQSTMWDRYDKELTDYQTRAQEIDDNPESAERDYDGIIYPTPPTTPTTPITPKGYYSEEMFNDLTNLKNLVEFSRGEEGLDWLVHHKVEYDFEVIDEAALKVIEHLNEQLDIEKVGLEPDLVNYLLSKIIINFQDKELNNLHFITKAIVQGIKSTNKKKLMDNLKGDYKNFAKIKPLKRIGLTKIINEYNSAYEQSNLLTMQKIWSIFTRTQHLINKDNYQKLLEQEYKEYKKAQETYYMRIYPTSDTDKLVYPSKKPHKVAKLDIRPIFGELARVGKAAKDIFIEQDKNDQTNLLTAIFYFLISDRPHDPKIKNHNRIFVPVQITFSNIKNILLSFDTDKVYLSKGELQSYLLPQNDEEKVLLHLLHDISKKQFRKLVFDKAKQLIIDQLNKKQNFDINSKHFFLNFIKNNNFLSIFINIIKNNGLANDFSNFVTNKKLNDKLKDKNYIKGLVADFANELELEFAKAFAEHFSKIDHKTACEIIKNNTQLDYSQLFHKGSEHPDDHSERVLLQLLKDKEYLKYIADNLVVALQKETKATTLPDGKYKIYWAGLFLHSSNSECNNCTLSLIGLQNSYQEGFLNHLINYLNFKSGRFKVRGYDQNNMTKFRLTTVVAFDKNLTEQAHHITGEELIERNKKSVENQYYNPRGKLSFFGRSINIKEAQRGINNSNVPYHGDFFEFHTKFFQTETPSKVEKHFKYSGVVFMSGSKNKKLKDKSEIIESNIENIISNRIK